MVYAKGANKAGYTNIACKGIIMLAATHPGKATAAAYFHLAYLLFILEESDSKTLVILPSLVLTLNTYFLGGTYLIC